MGKITATLCALVAAAGVSLALSSANALVDYRNRDRLYVTTPYYVVKSGDTLWSIAKKLTGKPLNYECVLEKNDVEPKNLHAGQYLDVGCLGYLWEHRDKGIVYLPKPIHLK